MAESDALEPLGGAKGLLPEATSFEKEAESMGR